MKTFNDVGGGRVYLVWMKWFLPLLVATALCSMSHASTKRPSLLLLADDDEYDLLIEKYYLKDYDCLVTTCTRPNDALRLLRDNFYDYGMLDLWLNGQVTALDVIAQSQPKNPKIIFWVLSGNWSGQKGTKMLVDTMRLNQSTPYIVQAIVKGSGTPTSGDLRGFGAMLEMSNIRRKK